MSSPKPSIVPSMSAVPVTPAAMTSALVLSGYGISALLLLVVLLSSPFVLALPGIDAPSLFWLLLSQALLGGVVLLAITARGVRQMKALYQVLLGGPREVPTTPPPPPEAVRAAFRFPERAAIAVVVSTQLIPLVDGLGIVPISGLKGWPRASVAMLSMAVGAAAAMPSVVLFRQLVWRWLGRLHPADVALPTSQAVGRRLAVTVALPVGIVGTSALVVFASHMVGLRTHVLPEMAVDNMPIELDVMAGGIALAGVLATTFTAWSVAKWAGDLLSVDLTGLTRHITFVTRGVTAVDTGDFESFHAVARTPMGKELAQALTDLALRFAAMRQKEREGRIAMEQVHRLRTQFLATMSHDLRSPLNSILGFAALVESEADGPITPEQRESLQMIARSAHDLLRLVNNILDSARIEAGRLSLRPTWVSSADLVQQAVAAGTRLIGDRALSIQADLQPDLPSLFVDQDRIVQALVGLFSHAIDAMQQGDIRLVAQLGSGAPGPEGQYVQIDVIDSGPGIREADQDAIFQAFREIQDPSGRRIGGLGLGLSVARELVRAHGGEAWFDNEPGRGTTFSLAIPVER